jgi:hypothetical protein
MKANNGIFCPQNFIQGRYIFFALDNCDFAEDTPDGKSTLHGTSIAVYQQKHSNDVQERFRIEHGINKTTLDQLPTSMIQLLPCNNLSGAKPTTPIYPDKTCQEQDSYEDSVLEDLTWISCATLLNSDCEESEPHIPPWGAYHSMLSTSLPLTPVSTPPLIPAPPHEWRTLYTALKQCSDINALVFGQGKQTVVTLDMGLYQPAQRLVMSQNDLSNVVLRPGELHVVMAMFRTIGSYIANSGLDSCWIEADMYGSTTCKNILDGGHVRRSVEAHTVTLLALFKLYLKSLFDGDCGEDETIRECSVAVNNACKGNLDLNESHNEMFHQLKSMDLLQLMKNHDNRSRNSPMFSAMRQYMEMVLIMLQFIKAFHKATGSCI